MLSKTEMELFHPAFDRVGLAADQYVAKKYDVEHVALIYHCDAQEVRIRLLESGRLRQKSVTHPKYDHQLIWQLHVDGCEIDEIREASGASRNIVLHVIRLGQTREAAGLPPICA